MRKNMRELKTAISVSSLKKHFQDKEVLKGIDFSVFYGTIYTLLGSNGAGKTTTIRILTTQIKADSGQVKIAGYDVLKNPKKVRENISLTGQFSAVDNILTGKENLIMMGRLYHLSSPEKKAYELLEYFGLSDVANKTVSTYSGGMKRKLDIAMSLVGNPKVIFLDEPTTGLDPQSRHSMWNMIQELNRSGVTIFLTTQYLEEAEQLADKIAILDKGHIIAEGNPAELKTYLPQGVIQFSFKDTEHLKLAKSFLKNYRTSMILDKCELSVFTDGKADTLAEIFYKFYKNNVSIRDFSKFTPNLEDVFLTMINEREEKNNASLF